MSAPRQNPPEYKDEDVLAALLVADMQYNDERETFRRHYEGVRLTGDVGLPTFEEAISRGWFRIVCGRVRSPRLLLDFLRHRNPPYESTLFDLLLWRHKAHVDVSKTSLGVERELLVEFLTSEEGARGIDTLSPQWVAARLWDRDPDANIKVWVRKWGLLGSPAFSASKIWDGVADCAQRFCEAAISALSDSGLVTWDEFFTGGEAIFVETGSMPWAANRAADVSPNHLLGKYLRLQRHSRGYFRDVDDDKDLLQLVDLLCVDGVEQFPAREPHVNILAVVKLAQRHPSVLMQLTLHIRRHPELLAELLLLPETTLLACYLVATWDEFGSGEREAMQELDRATRAIAFDDCMAVLAHVSREGEVSAVELSELLTLLVGMSLRSNEEGRYAENLALQVCAMMPEQQEGVLRELAGRAGQSVDDSDFVALLSLLSTVRMDVARQVAGDVARVYLRYMQNEDGFFEPTHITRAHAHVLWELVLGLPEEIVSRTLNPIDVKDLLTNLEGDEKEKRIIHLCRAMRAHMRLLARGISSYQGTAPRELIEALARAIRSGAQRHDEKGRLPAFSRFYDVTFSLGGKHDKPITVDLSDAIRSVQIPESRQRLVDELLNIDEPGVLAHLLVNLPEEYQHSIKRKILALEPADAAQPASLTEVQSNIHELLAAGLPDVAAKYIAIEREMKTWGTVPGRIAQRLRSNLYLQLLRGDYDAVLATTVPDEISDGKERAAAQSVLDFYQGLAYLHATPPDASRAAGIFKRLFDRAPIPAHAINLLAARVGKLLGNSGFALLQGRDVQSAELALKDGEDRLVTGSMNGVERAIHNSNRAALLLSLARPERAIEALRQVNIEHINAACMAYEAIALSRLDRKGEALALLVTATEKFGTVPIIDAARAYLDDGAVRSVPVQTIDREETLQYLRAALQMLADMGIERQAAVRQHDHPPFERMMTDMVRMALASLSQMVWALEGRRGARHKDVSSEPLEEPRRVHHEDVYNTLVREILIALVTPFYRWSVADQSLGGFTENGNAGERDLVVKKDLTEIAVIEAVKALTPGNTQLRKHFTKLPNYSNCKLFFHVTYAFSRAPSTILDAVHRMAENPPEGLTRLETEKIEQTDSQPPGVLASYTDGDRKITIVFLVVDLLQAGQRGKFVGESAASLDDSGPGDTQE